VVRRGAGQDDGGVAVGLVDRLIRGERQAAQVEDVGSQVGDEPVEVAALERVEQALEMTQLGRQRLARKFGQRAAMLARPR
jgi:hypothetical protein